MRAVKQPHLVEGFDENGEQDVEAHNGHKENVRPEQNGRKVRRHLRARARAHTHTHSLTHSLTYSHIHTHTYQRHIHIKENVRAEKNGRKVRRHVYIGNVYCRYRRECGSW